MYTINGMTSDNLYFLLMCSADYHFGLCVNLFLFKFLLPQLKSSTMTYPFGLNGINLNQSISIEVIIKKIYIVFIDSKAFWLSFILAVYKQIWSDFMRFAIHM